MSDDDRLIAGRYRLGERIGSGGMGVVWQAYDERLGRTVAVKQLLLPAYLAGAEAEEAKQRARRESRIAARIQHPNVIAIYDVVEDEGHTCLVMEYLPSKSLSEVVEESGPLPPVEAAQIGVQAARALGAAHAVGVVHRDVKPGNVLLGESDARMVKIVDFGIARAAGDVTITMTGLISGTPAFLSPEVAKGENATSASDVFSLGATLYAAIEGAPPFGRNDNAIALLHRVASGQINPPRRAGVMTPVLLRMLNPNPAGRPSMNEASRALEAVISAATPRAGGSPSVTPPFPEEVPTTEAAPSAEAEGGTPAAEESPDPEGTTVSLGALAVPESAGDGGPAGEADPPGRPDARRRAAVWIGALACVLALATVAAVFALPTLFDLGEPSGQSGRGGDPTTAASTRSSEPERTPDRSPSPDEEPSTSPTGTPSKSPDDAPAKPSLTARQAILAYYRLMPDRPSAGWTWLSDRYRQTTSGSFASYRSWWSQFRSVRVSVLSASGGNPATVQAQVHYTRRDGREFREVHRYTLVRKGRRWLIDASSVIRG
jgi:hypothetical protein